MDTVVITCDDWTMEQAVVYGGSGATVTTGDRWVWRLSHYLPKFVNNSWSIDIKYYVTFILALKVLQASLS